MSEAEILSEFALRADRVWDITQWWASVTPIGNNLLDDEIGGRGLTMILTLGATYLSTVFYVLYSYLKQGCTYMYIIQLVKGH